MQTSNTNSDHINVDKKTSNSPGTTRICKHLMTKLTQNGVDFTEMGEKYGGYQRHQHDCLQYEDEITISKNYTNSYAATDSSINNDEVNEEITYSHAY
ncbi:unnamed protein product [Schistosoma spindalis]|nr:unnamed protein product [Schistosoma spindale]